MFTTLRERRHKWHRYYSYYSIPTSFVSTFSYCCKHFGIPEVCTFTWFTYNMVQKLVWWLYESKHVATFIIDNKISCVLTELTLEYLRENTSGWLQLNETRWMAYLHAVVAL